MGRFVPGVVLGLVIVLQIQVVQAADYSLADGETPESCNNAKVVGHESDSDMVNLLAHRLHRGQSNARLHRGESPRVQAMANPNNVPVFHRVVSGLAPLMNVAIGTPPQVVLVLVDTGSSTLGVPGQQSGGLPECDGDMEAYATGKCVVGGYTPNKSSTVVFWSPSTPGCNTPANFSGMDSEACGFDVHYGDKSGMSGPIVNDTVSLGNLSATVSFGSIYVLDYGDAGFQEPPAAGIMGLSGEPGNCLGVSGSQGETCRLSAFAAVLDANGLDHAFGMCLGDIGAPGVVTLGGPDSQFYTGPIYKTPLIKKGGY